MFRRSRFSVRPNVSTVGRTTAGTSQEPPAAANHEVSEKPKEAGDGAAAVIDKSNGTPSENITASGDGNEQNGEGTSSSASVQRRKRFSIKPKVTPGRPPALTRTPKSPVKAACATPADVSGSDTEKPSTSSKAATATAPRGLQSPRRRRLYEDGKQLKVQSVHHPPVSSETSGTVTISSPKDSSEQTHLPTAGSKQAENPSGCQVKEVSPRLPEKVPPSLPDKEATEMSEKAKTLISSKHVVSMTPSALSLSRLLNDPSDVQRLMKAQKLRELLRHERFKEKKFKKAKTRQKEFTLDPTKMTMRDLIHYLPLSNPMMSNLEGVAQEDETVIPPSPRREKSPERAQQAGVLPDPTTLREEEEGGDAATEEEQDEALMVPQVKVAEDGSLIIDEESLTVEVQRAKGPNPAQDREPIFERGSTTTYSSFKKAHYAKPWSIEETDMFFLAVSMVGTDFSMICQLFPHRARLEIKNKFKKEERENSWRIDKAFKEKRKLDLEYFTKLLEKVMEFQKNKKKLKSLSKKNATQKIRTKAKRKKSAKSLSDVEEEEEDESLESEDGGEKENEDQCNEGGVPASDPKKSCKRKKRTESLTEEPNEKITKMGEADVPEDSETALPEDQTSSDMPEKDAVTKPAKLSRGRASKPLLPLGLKRGNKVPPARKCTEATANKEESSSCDKASEEQVNEEKSDLSCANSRKSASDEVSSEDEAAVKPQRPTRYGRVPKPIQPLTYPSKEDPHASESETTPAKSKCVVKRGKLSTQQSSQKVKKPKLVTIRSSKSDFSDEESENEFENNQMEGEHLGCRSSKDAEASLFVPSSLHLTNMVVSEVDDAMVELDILDSMPDVLGISQDALFPDSSCQKAQDDTGTAEPCEHQLDLLVDVIDFLSSEHTEDSPDESYNEAAQTLLTIGNLTHDSQSAQSEMTTQDFTKEITLDGVNASDHSEDDMAPSALEQSSTTLLCPTYDQDVREASQTVCIVGLQSSEMDLPHIETSIQTCTELSTDPVSQLTSDSKSSKTSPVLKTRCFVKVKPKPKLSQTLRTSQKKTEQHVVNERTSAEEVTPEQTAPALLEDNISSTEVKLSEGMSSVTQTCSLSAPQFEPSRNQTTTDTRTPDSTEERLILHGETANTCNSAVAKSHQESSTLSDPLQESRDKHAPRASDEDSPVSQKEQCEVATSSKPKGNRFPKIKPKPNLTRTARAARNKPQVSEETVEKDTLSSLKPETESSSFSLKHTKQVKIQSKVANQAELDVTLDQSATENQNISEVQLTEDSRLTSEFTEENFMPQIGSADPTVAESQLPEGSNVALEATQEKSDNPATSIDPVEERTVNKVASTCQLRRSRTQKTKPKPKVPQTSRAVRSKHQTTEEPGEKGSCPGSNPDVPEKKIAELEQKSTSTFDKQTESYDSASCLKPPLTSGSSGTPLQEDQTNIGQDQINMETASDQSVVRKPNFSDLQPEEVAKETTSDTGFNSEFTGKNLSFLVETSESSCNNTVDSVGVEVHPHLQLDSAPVQEQSGLFIKPAQDCKVASACPSKSRQLPKMNPKPNVPQTSPKFKPLEEPTKKDSTSSPNVESQKKIMTKVQREPTCKSQREKQTQDQSKVHFELGVEQVARDVKSSEFKDANLTSHVGTSHKCHNVALTSQSITQTQDGQESNPTSVRSGPPAASQEFLIQEKEVASACQLKRIRSQKIKPRPNLPQISRTARLKPRVSKKALDQDSSCTPPPDKTTNAEVETQPCLPEKQSEDTDVGSDGGLDLGTSVESTSGNQNLFEVQPEQSLEQDASEMNSSKFKGTNLTSYVGTSKICSYTEETADLRCRDSQVGKRATLDSTSLQDQSGHLPALVTSVERLAVGKQEGEPDLSQDHVTAMQHLDKTQILILSSKFSDKTKEEEAEPTCSTWLPDNLNQNKRTDSSPVSSQLLESAPRCTEESSSCKEQLMPNIGQVAASEDAEQIIPQRRQRFPKVKPKPNLGSVKITRRNLQSVDGSKHLEKQLVDSYSIVTSEQQPKESTKNKMSKDDGLETDLASSEHGKVKMSDTQPVIDQTGITDVQSTRKETTSISHKTDSSDQSSDQMPSEMTASKAPAARRGRLIKPKPNLQRSSRPQQPQQVQSTKPTEADSSSCSRGVGASVDHTSVCDLRPDHQGPSKGTVEKLDQKDSSSNDARSSLGFVTQSTTQDESTSSAEGIFSHPLISEFLPAEVPSDPDEPFFILSLTAIPVSSVVEGVNSASEHLPGLTVTDSLVHQPSTSLEAAGDAFVSTKERSVGICVDIGQEPAISQQGRENAAVQPPEVSETMESNKTETPPSTQTQKVSVRKGKQLVKSKASSKKQISSAATETEAAVPESDHPECSEQPQSSGNIMTEPHEGGGGHAAADKTLTGGREADKRVTSQTTQSSRSRRQSKKAEGCSSFSPSTIKPPSRKATSKKTRTVTAEAKISSSELTASTSKDVPTPRSSQPSTEACLTSVTPPDVDIAQTGDRRLSCSHSTPSSHLRTAEASTNDCTEATCVEEEPTSVSHYFLSDIFTEVDDG